MLFDFIIHKDNLHNVQFLKRQNFMLSQHNDDLFDDYNIFILFNSWIK